MNWKNMHFSVDMLIESAGGGSMKHVRDLYEELSRRDHDIRLIVSKRRAESHVIEWLDVIDKDKVFLPDIKRSPELNDVAISRSIKAYIEAGGGKRILHAHSTKAGILSKMIKGRDIKHIYTPHAYRGMDPTLGYLKRKLIVLADKFISSKMDHIIAVSPEERDYALALRIPDDKISYIPNGIDIESIKRISEKNRPKKNSIPRLGFAGRMTRQKNPILFLDVFNKLKSDFPALEAVMIGDGDMTDEVKSKIIHLGLSSSVKMMGGVDFVENMHEMDILVHTSLYESFPYLLLEAGAGGLAVVCVRNAGSLAIWPDGKLADFSVDSLCSLIKPLINSDYSLQEEISSSKKGAERYSISAMVDGIEMVYQNIQ